MENSNITEIKKLKAKCSWCQLMDVKGNLIIYKNRRYYHTDCLKAQVYDEVVKFLNQKRISPMDDSHKFNEKKLENYIIRNIECIEKGMSVIERQYKVENGIIDILAKDKDGVKCIIELKVISDCKSLIYQCAYYPTQFNEQVRMIAICPWYTENIYKSLLNIPNVEMKNYYFIGYADDLIIENFQDK